MRDGKFVIRGSDFCCTSAAIRDGLIYNGYMYTNARVDKKDATRMCWWFKVDERMITILEEYLGGHITWDK